MVRRGALYKTRHMRLYWEKDLRYESLAVKSMVIGEWMKLWIFINENPPYRAVGFFFAFGSVDYEIFWVVILGMVGGGPTEEEK